MGVRVSNPRGFAIVGEHVTIEVAERASRDVEELLSKHGITPADIQWLIDTFRGLGESGVDLQQLSKADYQRYGIDPKHVKANRELSAVLNAARASAPTSAGSYLGFVVEPVHA